MDEWSRILQPPREAGRGGGGGGLKSTQCGRSIVQRARGLSGTIPTPRGALGGGSTPVQTTVGGGSAGCCGHATVGRTASSPLQAAVGRTVDARQGSALVW